MTEQWWALLDKDGSIIAQVCSFDKPDAKVEGIAFHHALKLERRSDLHGEFINSKTGDIELNMEFHRARAIQAIKEEAGRRITAQYPLWKQINDADLGVFHPDVLVRKAARDEVRAWSNDVEAQIAKAETLADIKQATDA